MTMYNVLKCLKAQPVSYCTAVRVETCVYEQSFPRAVKFKKFTEYRCGFVKCRFIVFINSYSYSNM